MSNLLLLGLIVLTGFFCQWLAWRTKLPAILFLLLCGIAAGPLTGILQPDHLFGDLLFPFISLSVAIILFEGSLTLKKSELQEIGSTVRNMVSYGALANAVITTFAAHYLAGLSWPLAALFGAIMVVTGPTVIVPMLQSVKPNAKIARTLRWEGIVIDPLGALFAVLVFEWILAQHSGSNPLHVALIFAETIGVGAIVGLAGGYLFGLLLRHHLLPEYLHNYAAVALVAGVFVLSDSVMHESGLLAVTVMGICLANMSGVHLRSILDFKESLTVIFVSVLFILLAARIDFRSLQQLGWGALGVLLVMQLVSRPLKVFISTLRSSFTKPERALLAWIGPRGIVAAAVSAAFALRLEEAGLAQAHLMVPLAFSVIIGTVVIQSTTARPLAKLLGVVEPDTLGFLIVGANPVSIKVAQALQEVGVESVLCDNYWDNISSARMAGMKTYYGNPISEHAYVYLNTAGLGGMLGLSHHHERNMSAALRFREDFGIRNIFILASQEERKLHDKHRTSEYYKGRILFGEDVSYGKLAGLISRNAETRKTTLSDTYTFENWQTDSKTWGGLPLFACDPAGRVHWFTTEGLKKNPAAGWIILSLYLPDNGQPGKEPSK